MSEQPGTLVLSPAQLDEMIAHCLSVYPEEGCGLLAGHLASGEVTKIHPTRNAAGSARLYRVDPGEHLRADRDAEACGAEIIGVFHSHTHTDAYPSPTDVEQALDPDWHYLVVSFRLGLASTRSFRIRGGKICEEPVVVYPDRI